MEFILAATWLALYVGIGGHLGLIAVVAACAVQPLTRAATRSGT